MARAGSARESDSAVSRNRQARHAGSSGSLRGGDGDGAAGAEPFQLPQEVGSALLGRLPPGAEVSAEVLVRLAAPEHLVSDLQQGAVDREDCLLHRGRVLRAAEPASNGT